MADQATDVVGASREQRALAVLRVWIGLLFVWVFFENLGKGAYTPAGYKGVIDYYVKMGHAPDLWKGIMSVMAANARFVAPIQAATELSFGVLLVTGTATRVVAAAAGAFLCSLWLSELGTSWFWELGHAHRRRLRRRLCAGRTHLGRGRPAGAPDSRLEAWIGR